MIPIPSNESFGDAFSQWQKHQQQTWNNGTGSANMLYSGHLSQPHIPLSVSTVSWKPGHEPVLKSLDIGKSSDIRKSSDIGKSDILTVTQQLPSSDKRVSIIPYSSLNGALSKGYNPMGSVRGVGEVVAFHGNVRECRSAKGESVYVTSDNHSFSELQKAQSRQFMIDKR
jgi:hypothetical protein